MRHTVILGALLLTAVCGFNASIEGDLGAWSQLSIDPPSPSLGLDRGMDLDIAINPNMSRAFIAYYDATNGDLRLAEYVGSGGNCADSTWSCWTIDSTSSADDMGLDMISLDETLVVTQIARFSRAICTNLLASRHLQKALTDRRVCLRFLKALESQGLGTSHPAESRNLGVSYFDFGNLKLAYEEMGGNCGPLKPQDGGGFAHSWRCGTLSAGDSGAKFGAAAALASDEDGGIIVGYSREAVLTGDRGLESAFPWIARDNFESGDTSAWSSEVGAP